MSAEVLMVAVNFESVVIVIVLSQGSIMFSAKHFEKNFHLVIFPGKRNESRLQYLYYWQT